MEKKELARCVCVSLNPFTIKSRPSPAQQRTVAWRSDTAAREQDSINSLDFKINNSLKKKKTRT